MVDGGFYRWTDLFKAWLSAASRPLLRFAAVDEETLGEAMTLAWQNAMNRQSKPARKPATEARS